MKNFLSESEFQSNFCPHNLHYFSLSSTFQETAHGAHHTMAPVPVFQKPHPLPTPPYINTPPLSISAPSNHPLSKSHTLLTDLGLIPLSFLNFPLRSS
ncbi:hypothetical protein C1H46_014788 [Malus baccata]|uniref:Uncharacterized protein n=1 Tax=Malus baccata TaxID=106549 RepID=A0A540MN57_MALBA|nr:hypothetical protein C1H46_014788 [Malus baccata]